MTVQRLRMRMRKLREWGEDVLEETGELNLIPYLDIVMNVIMFLMVTVTYEAVMGHINVNMPARAPDVAMAQKTEQDQKVLNLTVSISESGYTIATAGGVLYEGWSWGPGELSQATTTVPTIPLKNKDYDYARLTQQIRLIKDHYPDESKVIINADRQITYDKVVATMDAVRNDGNKVLFPDVLLSAGVSNEVSN